MDSASIQREYGVKAGVAEAWMRQLPKVHHPGGTRKVFIWRADLERLLEEATIAA